MDQGHTHGNGVADGRVDIRRHVPGAEAVGAEPAGREGAASAWGLLDPVDDAAAAPAPEKTTRISDGFFP